MSSKTIPAMAEAVERRRKQLGLTIGDLADHSGLTRQGLDPVRKGERRQYNDRTIMGVARGLQWDLDWYDRILAGQEPTNAEQPTNAGDESWDELKSGLSEQDRAAVRAIIESLKAKRS